MTYCILGLQLFGEPAALDAAAVKLKAEGWKADVRQISPSQRFLVVDANGQSLPAITSLLNRINAGQVGGLQAVAISVPVAGFRGSK